jgi:hypothetical protein
VSRQVTSYSRITTSAMSMAVLLENRPASAFLRADPISCVRISNFPRSAAVSRRSRRRASCTISLALVYSPRVNSSSTKLNKSESNRTFIVGMAQSAINLPTLGGSATFVKARPGIATWRDRGLVVFGRPPFVPACVSSEHHGGRAATAAEWVVSSSRHRD